MTTRLEPPTPVAGLLTVTPATLPASALATFGSRASTSSAPPTSATEYPTDFRSCSIPNAVTTTSSRATASSPRVMTSSRCPSTSTVSVSKPM